jgi:hypothetical protein
MRRRRFLLGALGIGALVSPGIAPASVAQERNPLEGAWELVHGRYGSPDAPVVLDTPERPVQLKLFVSGRFAYVRQEPGGPFQAASAGRYSVEADRYVETTDWSSSATAVGSRVSFAWKLTDDVLCFTGPVEVLDEDGNSVDTLPGMVETYRRAGADRADPTVCCADCRFGTAREPPVGAEPTGSDGSGAFPTHSEYRLSAN